VLTLLALVLAIGLVVDDAIIVIENIQRRIDSGESPLVASVLGSKQVTFAVIATSITLISVFIPISFLEGAAGRLFTEFGFVMASSVGISMFVALSACPALASKILRPALGRAHGSESRGPMTRLANGYRRVLGGALSAPLVVIVIALAYSAGAYLVFNQLPSELTPREDRGVLFVPLTTPQGSNVGYTDAQTREVEEILAPLVESGEVTSLYSIVGSWGRPYRAFVVVRLADWSERERTAGEIITDIAPSITELAGARGYPASPAGLGLRGSSTPLRVVVSGPDFESVKEWSQTLLARAQDNPQLRNAQVDFEQNQPQVMLSVNRDRTDDLGIPMETVATTLQTMLASRNVTEFVDRGREYPVILQASSEDRQTPSDISNIFIRGGDGSTLVPLAAVVDFRESAASASLRRYNRLPSITIEAALAEGYDLGTAINFMREAAEESLPEEAFIGFSGQSQQYLETSGGVAVTFALALLIVFLVLAAQFESWIHPLIIMLSVPLAIAGAIYTLELAGFSLNLYSQIGIILLIGLMAKNGILIVEFANQLRDEGHSVHDAVIESATLRLRPILMTVIATILGAVPLAIASGAGAESRTTIGFVIIGGLSVATVLTLFLTPVLYSLLAGLSRPRAAVEQQLEKELGALKTPNRGHTPAGDHPA
jgi:multidrug efflux pump